MGMSYPPQHRQPYGWRGQHQHPRNAGHFGGYQPNIGGNYAHGQAAFQVNMNDLKQRRQVMEGVN